MSLGELNPKQNGRNVPGCMQLIAYQNISATTAAIIFPNIPQTYNHLRLISLSRSSYAGTYDYPLIQLNGDTGSNYVSVNLQSQNTTASCNNFGTAANYSTGLITAANDTANYPGTFIINFPFYTNNTFFKNINSITSAVAGSLFDVNNGQWINSTIQSINQIKAFLSLGSYIAGSTFSLYGIT